MLRRKGVLPSTDISWARCTLSSQCPGWGLPKGRALQSSEECLCSSNGKEEGPPRKGVTAKGLLALCSIPILRGSLKFASHGPASG